jgi:hypothetical protein
VNGIGKKDAIESEIKNIAKCSSLVFSSVIGRSVFSLE